MKAFRVLPGWYIALDDIPPTAMNWTRPVQEILGGERDVDRILGILDDEWERARKGD